MPVTSPSIIIHGVVGIIHGVVEIWIFFIRNFSFVCVAHCSDLRVKHTILAIVFISPPPMNHPGASSPRPSAISRATQEEPLATDQLHHRCQRVPPTDHVGEEVAPLAKLEILSQRARLFLSKRAHLIFLS